MSVNSFLWQTFIVLFVIIDPFVIMPAFANMTRHDTPEQRRIIAKNACLIGLILLTTFAFIGDAILNAMGISEPAFRIAGGFLLLIAAIDMVVAKNTGFRSTGEEEKEILNRDDITVFPLAIPLIAGPGSLTSIVILMRQAAPMGKRMELGVVFMAFLVLVLVYISLLFAPKFLKVFGVTGTNVLTRVFGIILSAVAVQSIINGIAIIFSKL